MRILLAAMEMTPYMKIGGIADVIYYWAKTLFKYGHEVTVVLPVIALDAPPPPPWLDLQVLNLDEFSSDNPYQHEEDYAGIHVHRLYTLSQAIIALCENRAQSGRPFDILHVNEWPVAVLPFLLLKQNLSFPRPATVLTIHSVLYCGVLPAWAFEQFQVNPLGPPRIIDQRGLIHPLAAGILSADIVTVPSPSYAREFISSELREVFGEEIFQSIIARSHEIHGILHGLDLDEWNPANDKYLPYCYDVSDLSGKHRCKSHLENELHLAGKSGSPVVLFAGRLCAAKGIDLLVKILPFLYSRNVRVIIAGAGEPIYEQMVKNAVKQFPQGYCKYVGWADTATIHRLYAASDILAVPSRHEACGLAPIEALRYGTVPVVRRCGGLTDTIIDYNSDRTVSTGFMFMDASVSDLCTVLNTALALLPTPEFIDMQRRCMNAPQDWNAAIEKYESLYRQAIYKTKANS